MNQNETFTTVISFAIPLMVLAFVCSLVGGMVKAMAGSLSSSSSHHSSASDTYEATIRLLKDHPEVAEDIKKLFEISVRLGTVGLISGEEAELAGIRPESLRLCKEYGIIRTMPSE